MARASIVIPVWNGAAYLPACLDALLPQLGPADEVIAVDNASPDGSAALIAGRYPRVRLLRQAQNLGFAGGCNAGLRAAEGQYLLLLNQDTTVAAGWLEAMLAGLAPDDVGIAGCKLYFPGGRLQHAGGYLTPPAAWPGHYGLGEEDAGQHDAVRDVEYVIGAALGTRRSVLDRIGLLDEGYFLYYEDVDLCLRCRRAGLRVVYLPGAAVVHVESATTVKGSPAYLERFYAARLRLILKHYPAETIFGATLPYERERLAGAGPVERAAAAAAYVSTLAALPEISAARARDGGREAEPLDIDALAAVMCELRSVAASLPAGARPDRAAQEEASQSGPPSSPAAGSNLSSLIARLDRRSRLVPQPFRSQVPVLGPVIAGFRTLWNSVSTRWYLQPLLQQQTEFNLLAEEVLAVLGARVDERLAAVEGRLADLEAAPAGDSAWAQAQDRRKTEENRRLDDHDAWLAQYDREQTQGRHDLAETEARLTQIGRLLDKIETRLAALEAAAVTRREVS